MLGSAPPNCFRQLRERGFHHHVFLSWPNEIENQGQRVVEQLARSLQDRFRSYGGGSVFWDREALRSPGEDWEKKLRWSLCRSGVTVVILVLSYFESEFCRLEWNITEQLQQRRLPESPETCFIPILLKPDFELPEEVYKLVYESAFSQMLSYGKSPQHHPSWNKEVDRLVGHIRERLKSLCEASENPPDWKEEEAIAMNAGPKQFDWTKKRQPSIPGQGRKLPPPVRLGSKL